MVGGVRVVVAVCLAGCVNRRLGRVFDTGGIRCSGTGCPFFCINANLCGDIQVYIDTTDCVEQLCALGCVMLDTPYKMIRAANQTQAGNMNTDDKELWQLAVEKSPDPCAFVGMDDRFVHVNKAWCLLLGYAESELRQMTWPAVTKASDVGGDGGEVADLKSGRKDEYYLEKVYVRRDGEELPVGLYVHRYPGLGAQKGYIVFAKAKSTRDSSLEELKRRYQEMERMVLLFQHTEQTTKMLAAKMEQQSMDIRENRDLFMNMLQGSMAAGKGGVNIGDAFGNAGYKTTNEAKVIMYVMAGFGALVSALGVVAIVVAWVAYYGSNGNHVPPDIQPPAHVQPAQPTPAQ